MFYNLARYRHIIFPGVMYFGVSESVSVAAPNFPDIPHDITPRDRLKWQKIKGIYNKLTQDDNTISQQDLCKLIEGEAAIFSEENNKNTPPLINTHTQSEIITKLWVEYKNTFEVLTTEARNQLLNEYIKNSTSIQANEQLTDFLFDIATDIAVATGNDFGEISSEDNSASTGTVQFEDKGIIRGTGPSVEDGKESIGNNKVTHTVQAGETLWGIVKKHYDVDNDQDIARIVNAVVDYQKPGTMATRLGQDADPEDGIKGDNLWVGDVLNLIPEKKEHILNMPKKKSNKK